MNSKFLSAILLGCLASSMAFGADKAAVELSNKVFKANKEASQKEAQIRDICKKQHEAIMQATKDLTKEQRDEFWKEFKYQMRQNMATLGKNDPYNERVCGKFHKKPDARQGQARQGKMMPPPHFDHQNCQSGEKCPANQPKPADNSKQAK